MLTLPAEPGRERAVRAARLWFERCPDRLGGEFAATVRDNPPPPDRIHLSQLSPGDIWATVGTTIQPPGDYEGEPLEWDAPYSAASWQELLRKLGELPSVAAFGASTWSARGWHGPPSYTVDMGIDYGFVELGSTIDDALANDPAGQRRVLAAVREVAEVANPVAVAVATNFKRIETPLERALNRFQGRAEAGSWLRNYGWLTVLSDEMTERVGGLHRLRSSGAFVEVEPLAAGGTWLVATDTWDEYGPEQANRLFELLAPVLPPGRPQLTQFGAPVTPGGELVRTALPNVVAERDPREITG
ncbi:hypothetical protein Ate02nite_09020 [Paractinoplanes tereljensis]|uniref:Uncharacterized protein n=2 Tax=Paractinoplanes tereljensis TaxID=571912 RepID=A0A919TRK3_9ACTN|nr:hypothetical protein Ate02nite_09020 [Actinoplanes tereljensis]